MNCLLKTFGSAAAMLLVASVPARALLITDVLNTITSPDQFDTVEAYFISGGTFANPGFNNITDMEMIPNPLPEWGETIHRSLFIQARGPAISEIGLEINSELLGTEVVPYQFDYVALSSGIAVAYASIGYDGVQYYINELPVGSYSRDNYRNQVPDGGTTLMLLMGGIAGCWGLRRRVS